MLEETETLGMRISRFRHDRVLYEDNRTTKETINKFLDIMYELEDQGFQDVTEL